MEQCAEHKVNVFLPMRAGSERIKKKNTRPFAGIEGGLCAIKLAQLIECQNIKTIYVSTDDPYVVQICENIGSTKIKVIIRPTKLATSATSTDELIRYVPQIMPHSHILWTHVTSPFVGTDEYDQLIRAYFENIGRFDSLMTVTKVQKFLWSDFKPINYDRTLEKWPRTQTLEPIWEINSGAFLAHKNIYTNHFDRIGKNPQLFELDSEVAFDIDWISDFKIAEQIFSAVKNL